MSFSATLWPGIPPRSRPPCPASITTVIDELSPLELRLLLAAWELHARCMNSRPASDKTIPEKFLRITGRLWAPRAAERRVLVPSSGSFGQAHRWCRHERLFRRYRNEQDGAGFSFPPTKSAAAVRRL